MSAFRWTAKREQAALLLAEGQTQRHTAQEVGVSGKTIYRWLLDIEFAAEVDRLTHMVGVATRAERLRIAMRVIRTRMALDGKLASKKDLLDWLKFAQSETDGVKLDLTALAEAASQMADGGSTGTDSEAEDSSS